MTGSSQNDGEKDRQEGFSEPGLSERRAQLDRMLQDHRAAELSAQQKARGTSSGYGQAVKLSSEFIAGILVGAGIGWVADQWLGTSPFGLIVFLLLGFAAGVLNVLRAVGQVAEPGAKPPSKDNRDDGSS